MRRLLAALLLCAAAAPAFAQSPAPAGQDAAPREAATHEPAAPEAAVQAPAAAKPFVYNFKTPQLHRTTVDALLSVPGQVLFIDLRRPDEIARIGSFPVYLNIQIADLEKQLDFIPKERLIVTVSNHAARAGKAADLLADKGFRVIGAVGSQVYEEEGGKITRIVPPPPRAAEAAAPAQTAAARQ
jgi:rhodanese-related sulfurtransferase